MTIWTPLRTSRPPTRGADFLKGVHAPLNQARGEVWILWPPPLSCEPEYNGAMETPQHGIGPKNPFFSISFPDF